MGQYVKLIEKNKNLSNDVKNIKTGQFVSSGSSSSARFEMYYIDGVFANIASRGGDVLEIKYIDPDNIDDYVNYFPAEVINKMKNVLV
jgi:hypothetical protein